MLLQVTSSKKSSESSSYKIELRRMTSHFELLKLRDNFYRNSSFELQTQLYFSTFELLTQC